jgi:hypothetical protein
LRDSVQTADEQRESQQRRQYEQSTIGRRASRCASVALPSRTLFGRERFGIRASATRA